MLAVGASLREAEGSRIKVTLNDVYAVFHRPHPGSTVDKGSVRSVRPFLINAGVEPDEHTQRASCKTLSEINACKSDLIPGVRFQWSVLSIIRISLVK